MDMYVDTDIMAEALMNMDEIFQLVGLYWTVLLKLVPIRWVGWLQHNCCLTQLPL